MKPASAVRPTKSRLRPEGLAALLPRSRGVATAEARSLPDAAHLLPHPRSLTPAPPTTPGHIPPRLRPRGSRRCSGLLPTQAPALSGPSPAGSAPDSSAGAAPASRRLTGSPFPFPSRGSAPPMLPLLPPPPSLNHRALGERGQSVSCPQPDQSSPLLRGRGFRRPRPSRAPPLLPLRVGPPPPPPQVPTSLARLQLLQVLYFLAAARPPTSESALADQVRFNALTAFGGRSV